MTDQSYRAITLRIMKIIARLYEHGPSTIADLMIAADCSRATVYRLLHTMQTSLDVRIRMDYRTVSLTGAGVLSIAPVCAYVA
jgi:DNA-binding IclR family transcriptional regulator